MTAIARNLIGREISKHTGSGSKGCFLAVMKLLKLSQQLWRLKLLTLAHLFLSLWLVLTVRGLEIQSHPKKGKLVFNVSRDFSDALNIMPF